MKRQQTGHIFRRGKSWFLRYCDDVRQPDGNYKRKLVCRKLAEHSDQYRSEASVREKAAEILAPINAGLLTPESTTPIVEFVEKTYFPGRVEKKRAATRKQYRDVWKNHLKGRLGNITFRQFRTAHGNRLLSAIADEKQLGCNSLVRIKAFLSGVFSEAKRLDVLNGDNPMQGTEIPATPEPEDTYAYTLSEIRLMLAVLDEPAHTAIFAAAFTGLRKSEIWGLRWEDFNGRELRVNRAVWNGIEGPPKTARSKAPVPVVKELADALEDHRGRMGKVAPGYIFQAANGKPLNLDNLSRRVIAPALSRCAICGQPGATHQAEGHEFKRDASLPVWRGWHAFRRGLATNLHELGVDDRTIQAIMRHESIAVTQKSYIKHVPKLGVSAMDLLAAQFRKESCNVVATNSSALPN